MVSAIVIETGVPVPPMRKRGRCPIAAALRKLNFDQSVQLPLDGRDQADLSRIAFRVLGKGCYRTAPGDTPDTVRIWRTA